jgi:ABC-type antimicrobial peptide transport system permease subunit
MIIADFWQRDVFAQQSMVFAIRTDRIGTGGLLPEVRDAIWSVNPNVPLASVRTLAEILERSMARTSFTLVMLAIASGVALLLGGVGIYGVISYAVSQRTREIGVRMALGAARADVSRLVLREGLGLTLAGIAVGVLAAFGLTRLMTALLYGVSPADPLTYLAVAPALAAIALFASWLPARRAAALDPTEALRWE